MRRFLAVILIAAVIGVFTAALQAREVYIWTDENGIKHYSNIAPSEATDEFRQKEEIETSGRPERPQSDRDSGERPFRPSAAPPESTAENGASNRPAPADNDESASAVTTGPKLDLKTFPVQQGELVAREKAIVKNVKSKLEDAATDREALIEAERRRLHQAVEDLEKAPLSKFGSQQNKQRQVGYYKYRLEAIETDPDTYFEYGDSDYD